MDRTKKPRVIIEVENGLISVQTDAELDIVVVDYDDAQTHDDRDQEMYYVGSKGRLTELARVAEAEVSPLTLDVSAYDKAVAEGTR